MCSSVPQSQALGWLFGLEEPCRTPRASCLPMEMFKDPKTNLFGTLPDQSHPSQIHPDLPGTSCRGELHAVPRAPLSGLALWSGGPLRCHKSILPLLGNLPGGAKTSQHGTLLHQSHPVRSTHHVSWVCL